MTRPLVPAVVAVVGLAVATTVAALDGMTASATLHLLAYAGLGAAAAGVAAALLLRARRRAGITAQAVIAALAPVVAVALGSTWAASEMFIMPHDLWVLWVVLLASGTVGTITAVALGRRVAAASFDVTLLARGLGDGDVAARPAPTRGPGELVALAQELELTAARLAEARERSAAAERSRRELVAWVSHDLRTPLAGIRAMVEALEDGVVSDAATVARYHMTMRVEADRLAALVDDLFELSRIQAGALPLETEPVPLEDFVTDVVATAAAATAGRAVALRTRIHQPAPRVEMAVPEIVRVLRNLLDNAVRHTPAGGRVTVDAGGDGTWAWISVADSCGGIPDADLARVFEPGFRGDAARTPGDGRGGLGLAVARGLVQAHGGDVDAVNHGPGCRFTVRLPLAPLTADDDGTRRPGEPATADGAATGGASLETGQPVAAPPATADTGAPAATAEAGAAPA